LRHVTFAELSLGSSPVHRTDARTKLLLLLAAIGALSLIRRPSLLQLGIFWLLLVGISVLARLPLLRVLRLSLLVVSFAGFFAVVLYAMGDRQRALIILEKSYLSAFSVLIVAASTTVPALSAAARYFRIPGLLTEVVELIHRYLFVLIGEVQSMQIAFAARAGRPGRRAFQASSGMVAVLFARSLERSARVFRSMSSRGFTGRLNSYVMPPLRLTDSLLAVTGLAVLLAWSLLR
jgi:cobalt/nickel transport system permease protein